MFESDNEATPRPSTQRSSIDIEEFNPPAVTPATLKQRLVKFGTAFKHSNNNSNTENIGKAEADTQNARKKKGLRKSMSMWNIGGKKKSLNDSSHESMPKAVLPSKLSVTPIPKQDIEVLDGRKRKAEELYAQQFGMKKRKSVAGLHNSATEDEAEEMPSPKRHQPESQRGRRKSLPSSRQVGRSSSTTMNASDIPASQSDAESHKRPSRRELEKENQQLRELLRQQQQRQAQRQTSAHHGKESSSPAGGRPLPVPPEKSKPAADENCKPSVKKQTQTAQSNDIPPVPPVPSIPERAALRTLATGSSPSNSVANVIANNNASTKTNTNQATDTASPKRIVVGAGFPRPISMILEVDEEEGMEGKISSRSRIADEIQKLKEPSPSPLRMNGTKREQWEWPEDVF
jgi:type II secretory pathway pseudopilin PulG